MGGGMTVPNAVPGVERPSVNNSQIVPRNVPPLPTSTKHASRPTNPGRSTGTPTPKNAPGFLLDYRPFRSTRTPRERNGGTVSRARTLTKAATAGRSFSATRWRAAPERRARNRQRKRASKHLISAMRVLTIKTAVRHCSLKCPQVSVSDSPVRSIAIGGIGDITTQLAIRWARCWFDGCLRLRPWVLPVAFDLDGANTNAIKGVWRSGVPLADAWRDAKFARSIDCRPTKDRGWGAGGGKTAASSCWSGVFCFSRPFPKNLDRGLAT